MGREVFFCDEVDMFVVVMVLSTDGVSFRVVLDSDDDRVCVWCPIWTRQMFIVLLYVLMFMSSFRVDLFYFSLFSIKL